MLVGVVREAGNTEVKRETVRLAVVVHTVISAGEAEAGGLRVKCWHVTTYVVGTVGDFWCCSKEEFTERRSRRGSRASRQLSTGSA
jgi:hypothetical protein